MQGYKDHTDTIIVAFDADTHSIKLTGDAPADTFPIDIDTDKDVAYVFYKDKAISPDELSQLILEPLLFPKEGHARKP